MFDELYLLALWVRFSDIESIFPLTTSQPPTKLCTSGFVFG